MQAQPQVTHAAQQRAIWRDYLNLTKPRVISLLLLTTLCAMLVAAEGVPSLSLIAITLVGGYLAAGGAGALNCYLDQDIDLVMSRTKLRPLPGNRIQPRHALLFGTLLSVLSFLLLWLGANLLTAVLAFLGIVYYVLIYTRWLKRSTTHNIVIGGAAGAIPPLVGWAAVAGEISPAALLMFAIIFYWTPPHFWALALVRREDYARAGVPMLPVIYGDRFTRVRVVLYSVLLVVLSLMMQPFGYMGTIYSVSAALLGLRFIVDAVALLRQPTVPATWRLYKFSLLYLALLFAAMVVDRLLA